MVTLFNTIKARDLKFDIPLAYQEKMKTMNLIYTTTENTEKFNLYTNQVSETFYTNGTVKRSFEDGYTLYYFQNGDIKQVRL